MDAVKREFEEDVSPPSPLTGCYLLIVVGEPRCESHKNIILQRIAKGLLSWNVNDCLVDLEKELAVLLEQSLEGEEAKCGERLIQFASENLVTEILIHPLVSTLVQCIRNLLSSFTRHRHIIHAGYTFAANGSWALQDGTFSYADFSEAFLDVDTQKVIHAYENGISIDIHCSPQGYWCKLHKDSFTKGCNIRMNPTDILSYGSPSITEYINYLSQFIIPTTLANLLHSSDVVGNIRFSRPTLYVFPGGQGDAALFGINGFNMLLDGGYSRRACFWDFVRHLDRIDAILMTRLNNSNIGGISSLLRKKRENAIYPQIGHFFSNITGRNTTLSPDGDEDNDPLLINLLNEGQEIISNLHHLSLGSQVCYNDSEPIKLYHKVGHGTLSMYVLNPSKDSKEVKEFLKKWHQCDEKLFNTKREFSFPIYNLISIAVLLIWKPADINDAITRILYPGSCPQQKILEGMEKLKNLEYIKSPICTEKIIMNKYAAKKYSKNDMLEKREQFYEKKENTNVDNNIKTYTSEFKEKNLKGDDIKEEEKKSKNMDESKLVSNNGETIKVKSKTTKIKTDVQQRNKSIEKRDSLPAPKRTRDQQGNLKKYFKNIPAKSAKDANNRKVIENKTKALNPSIESKAKFEKKNFSSKTTKDLIKTRLTPIKQTVNGVERNENILDKGRSNKDVVTDSSSMSTPSADQDSLKKGMFYITSNEIQKFNTRGFVDLEEEQEAIQEIEAVFRKGEKHFKGDEHFRKIKNISTDEDKSEKEEYLIIEREDTDSDLLCQIGGFQLPAKDNEDLEKNKLLFIEENVVIQENSESKTQPKENISVGSKCTILNSQEDKLFTIEKKSDREMEVNIIESQPDEKMSANIKSGDTTTAPTLPEDERIPFDDIKEHHDYVIEEKYAKEETKEKNLSVIQLPPKTFNVTKTCGLTGIRLDKQNHIRDIVKTPDEVADLPVHEEVDYEYAHENKTEIKNYVAQEHFRNDRNKEIGKEKVTVCQHGNGNLNDTPKVNEETKTKKVLNNDKNDINNVNLLPDIKCQTTSNDDDVKWIGTEDVEEKMLSSTAADDGGIQNLLHTENALGGRFDLENVGKVIAFAEKKSNEISFNVSERDVTNLQVEKEPKIEKKLIENTLVLRDYKSLEENHECKIDPENIDILKKELNKKIEGSHLIVGLDEEVNKTKGNEINQGVEAKNNVATCTDMLPLLMREKNEKLDDGTETRVDTVQLKAGETNEVKTNVDATHIEIPFLRHEKYTVIHDENQTKQKHVSDMSITNLEENKINMECIDIHNQPISDDNGKNPIDLEKSEVLNSFPENAIEEYLTDITNVNDLTESLEKSRTDCKDVIKIVTEVAEELKSDASIEELEKTLPLTTIGTRESPYITELRETHITTFDTPEDVYVNSNIILSIPEESYVISTTDEEKNLNQSELIKSTVQVNPESKMFGEIDSIEEQETVQRMLVTTSSEDGGEVIELCPLGTITFSKSRDSLDKSSPDKTFELKSSSSVIDMYSNSDNKLKNTITPDKNTRENGDKDVQDHLKHTDTKVEDSTPSIQEMQEERRSTSVNDQTQSANKTNIVDNNNLELDACEQGDCNISIAVGDNIEKLKEKSVMHSCPYSKEMKDDNSESIDSYSIYIANSNVESEKENETVLDVNFKRNTVFSEKLLEQVSPLDVTQVLPATQLHEMAHAANVEFSDENPDEQLADDIEIDRIYDITRQCVSHMSEDQKNKDIDIYISKEEDKKKSAEFSEKVIKSLNIGDSSSSKDDNPYSVNPNSSSEFTEQLKSCQSILYKHITEIEADTSPILKNCDVTEKQPVEERIKLIEKSVSDFSFPDVYLYENEKVKKLECQENKNINQCTATIFFEDFDANSDTAAFVAKSGSENNNDVLRDRTTIGKSDIMTEAVYDTLPNNGKLHQKSCFLFNITQAKINFQSSILNVELKREIHNKEEMSEIINNFSKNVLPTEKQQTDFAVCQVINIMPSVYAYESTTAKYDLHKYILKYNYVLDKQLERTYLYDITKAETSKRYKSIHERESATDQITTAWGKPLGLPSPSPLDAKGTPKKEKRLSQNVTVKNKWNEKKDTESPSKIKNKKLCPVYVDLTYVPHHGNPYYSYVDFFKMVRARYYVFSGIEPAKEVYNALLEAKQTWDDKDLEVTIIPTYDTDVLGFWVAENEELLTTWKIDLSPSASRCTINLQDHETSCSAYRLEF